MDWYLRFRKYFLGENVTLKCLTLSPKHTHVKHKSQQTGAVFVEIHQTCAVCRQEKTPDNPRATLAGWASPDAAAADKRTEIPRASARHDGPIDPARARATLRHQSLGGEKTTRRRGAGRALTT